MYVATLKTTTSSLRAIDDDEMPKADTKIHQRQIDDANAGCIL